MKSTTFALASLLASAAVAQPHRHQQLHQKRQEIDWITEWDYVTETIDITETIWVSSGFVPPTTSSVVAAASTTSSSPASSSSPAEVPAQFFQGAQSSTSTSTVYVASTPATTSTYEAPTPSSTYVAPAPASSSSPVAAVVAPVESSSSSTPAAVYVAPTTTSVAAAAATTAASSDSTDSSSSSSYGATTSGCSSGTPCSGDITYYTAGLGACGTTTDGSVDKVVALPYGLMGTQSNGNPYCGQTITIKCSSTGKTTTATVVDKCMGCTGMSIDLSNAAFDELADESVGRTTAEWWFN